MKKWKLGLLSMLLVFAIAGCSGQKNDSQSPAPTQEAEPTATPEPTPEPTATPVPTEEPIVVTETFQSLFGQYGMKAGTCLSDSMITKKACTNIINEQFNSITFENHLKPDYILDQKESIAAGDLVVKFGSKTVELMEWCKNNDKVMRGHTLIWHSQTPNWIFYENFDTKGELVSREVMFARMEFYILQTFVKVV